MEHKFLHLDPLKKVVMEKMLYEASLEEFSFSPLQTINHSLVPVSFLI